MADVGEGGRSRRSRRKPLDVFRDAPESRAVWEKLPGPVLEAVARCDADRLEVELSGVAPHVREAKTAPLYSVAYRFASWERLVRRLEPDWPAEDLYMEVEYNNDLDSRDSLSDVMSVLVEEEGGQELSQLLECLDARFRAATVPDPDLSLRPWIRPTKERPEEELGEWWKRKPVRVPWAG
ncbi:hypothetical protein [Streptomyces mayonensis]|uniref:hypothetical protein n=1 Tax=Streptomyces mayonensis TaxID=2750816 RepID=UPI001C1DD0F4|nr:hypothetical protein [Streptomyces sp. A108]MBU6530880.1 hypothetical protein [Streptomyces sp. A108]